VPAQAQPLGQGVGEGLFVVHDKDAHGPLHPPQAPTADAVRA
jgi:hypothetical protein